MVTLGLTVEPKARHRIRHTSDHHLWNDEQSSAHAPFLVEWELRDVPDSAPFAMPTSLAVLLLFGFFSKRRA